ncbi:MAG: LysE family translocator [Thermoflexales bacterium]
MIDPSKFALFVAVSWALIIAPGPDMFYVITRGMAHGRNAGIISAVGVICGILVHTTAAALGITLIFQTSAFVFLVVKYLGATYLIYLGANAWRDKGAFNLQASTSRMSSRSLFWQGVLSSVLNPKIAVFFLAFLPQFVDQGNSQVALQMAILGLTFAGFGLCFLIALGTFAGTVGAWLAHSPRYTTILRRLTGGILISLGVRLAFLEQR